MWHFEKKKHNNASDENICGECESAKILIKFGKIWREINWIEYASLNLNVEVILTCT